MQQWCHKINAKWLLQILWRQQVIWISMKLTKNNSSILSPIVKWILKNQPNYLLKRNCSFNLILRITIHWRRELLIMKTSGMFTSNFLIIFDIELQLQLKSIKKATFHIPLKSSSIALKRRTWDKILYQSYPQTSSPPQRANNLWNSSWIPQQP